MIRDQTTGELLRETAARVPDVAALVEPDGRRWTYAELLATCEATARGLAERFAPGERIAAWANNLPEWVILELAAGLAGLTVVTVNPALREGELQHVLGRSACAGVFMIPSYRGTDMAGRLERLQLPALREIHDIRERITGSATLPAVSAGDAALILFTSGTTGVPKGAVLHHRGVVNNARDCYVRLGARVQVNPMPLFHAAGCAMGVLGSLAVGGTLILPAAYDPELILRLIDAERPDAVIGVPTMLIGLLDHPDFRTPPSVRLLLSGGAVVSAPLVRRAEAAFGARMSIVFAQTEASPIITQTSPDDLQHDREETLGTPLADVEVKLTEAGEICTRGYHVMTGYLDDPQATAAAIDADGWLHTGDLGTVDERGYYRIAGRLKDMIIRGGREHLSGGDRARADRAPRGRRRGRGRRSGREVGRDRRRVRAPGRAGLRAGAVRLVPRAARAAQDTGFLGVPRCLPDDGLREGAEVPPARALDGASRGVNARLFRV